MRRKRSAAVAVRILTEAGGRRYWKKRTTLQVTAFCRSSNGLGCVDTKVSGMRDQCIAHYFHDMIKKIISRTVVENVCEMVMRKLILNLGIKDIKQRAKLAVAFEVSLL